MSIRDYISSTGDSLKRNTPDLTAVRGWCWSSYGYSLAAVTQIDVKQKLNQLPLPDSEARSRIGHFATNFAKNATVYACHEGLKTIPGGTTVYKIVSKSLRDEKFVSKEVEIKELQAKLSKLEKEIEEIKEISKCPKSIEQAEILHEPCLEIFQSQNKPEDLIKIFKMHGFMGKHILDDQIVPGVTTKDPK